MYKWKVALCVRVETHIVLEQGDTRRWDKPRFDHCAVVLRLYYGGHILMGHYLNTLYPDSRSVSYSLGMWKKEKSTLSNLSFFDRLLSRHFSRYSFLFLFERRDASVPHLLSSSLSQFSPHFFSLFLIDRSWKRASRRKSLSSHFHVCWITRSSKSDRLAKFRWGWTITRKNFFSRKFKTLDWTNVHGNAIEVSRTMAVDTLHGKVHIEWFVIIYWLIELINQR